ncbi:2-oxoadipate dioxygenase/decarboxylase family protein [Shigella flexneri]
MPILLRRRALRHWKRWCCLRGRKQGTHTARFGEIETAWRGINAEGRQLYDDALRNAGTGRIISLTKCIYRNLPHFS